MTTADEQKGEFRRVSTGIAGLDHILGGGLPAGQTYLVQGGPGAGKTTLGMQFLLEGGQEGERSVYVALSENAEELRSIAASHGWDLEDVRIMELHTREESRLASSQYTFFHPSEIELSETTQLILSTVEEVQPRRIVFDSLSEMRLLAGDSLRYRRQLLALKEFFTDLGCTVLLLDVRGPDDRRTAKEFQLETLAHGVLGLEQLAPEYGGARRRLQVSKMRGIDFVSGYHDFKIVRGGLEVYPRLVASDHRAVEAERPLESRIECVDAMVGGGVDRGATTMFIGPAGVGKSVLTSLFACAALDQGERVAVYLFDEVPGNWLRRNESLGMAFGPHLESGELFLEQVDPAELSPGELAHRLRHKVEAEGVSLVLIDSMNGYRHAMPAEGYLTLHLHELFTYLNQRGVSTLVVVAQHGFLGDGLGADINISYLADTVVLLRYFEAFGSVRKAMSVIKKRTGAHERVTRELLIGRTGSRSASPRRDLRGCGVGRAELRAVIAARCSREAHADSRTGSRRAVPAERLEPAAPERVLICAPTGRDASLTGEVLADAGIDCRVYPSCDQLLESVASGPAS